MLRGVAGGRSAAPEASLPHYGPHCRCENGCPRRDEHLMKMDAVDYLILTVKDVEATCPFKQRSRGPLRAQVPAACRLRVAACGFSPASPGDAASAVATAPTPQLLPG